MTIRTLAPGEKIPDGTPVRYKNGAGYVRLRWHVGPEQYVEAYEHRVVCGNPPKGLHVHHLNRVRDDNRPENLVVMNGAEHNELHAREDAEKYAAARASRGGYKCVQAFEKAQRAEKRRQEIHERSLRMREHYERGLTTTEIGKLFNLDSSNVSIHLRRVGTVMRPFSSAKCHG